MTAAELNFPEYGQWSWLSLAQGVFNDQTAKPTPGNTGWDPTNCDGGVHWQKFEEQGGFEVKNAISNGGLFQLSARLYRYTNNTFYANWAQKIWDWSLGHLIVNGTFEVWDTVSIGQDDCHYPGHTQWTYNYASYLLGAAYMYAQVCIFPTPCSNTYHN
jgi:mannan endo-1,6-alpha-mannosidase